MKRTTVLTAVVLAMALALPLAACGGSSGGSGSSGTVVSRDSDSNATPTTASAGGSTTGGGSVTGSAEGSKLTWEAGFAPYPPSGPDAGRGTTAAIVVTNTTTGQEAVNVDVRFKLFRDDSTRFEPLDARIPLLPAGGVAYTGNSTSLTAGVTRIEVSITVLRWRDSVPDATYGIVGATHRPSASGGTEIHGTVTSTSPSTRPVKVGVLLVDAKGNPVGFAGVNVDDVPAGGQKPFSVTTSAPVPADWDIEVRATPLL